MGKVILGESKIPGFLYGIDENAGHVCLYIPEKSGSREDALTDTRALLAQGWSVLSADLPDCGACCAAAVEQNLTECLHTLYEYAAGRWEQISLMARGTSVELCLHALGAMTFEKAFFLLPVVKTEVSGIDWHTPTAVLLSSYDRKPDRKQELAFWDRMDAELTLASVRNTADAAEKDSVVLDAWLYLSSQNL